MPSINPTNSSTFASSGADQPRRLSVTLKQSLIYLYRYFNLVIILAVLAAFSLSFVYLLYPKYMSVQKGAEVQSKQEEQNQKIQYLIKLNQLRQTYQAINQSDKDKINAIINNTNNKDDLFNEMQALSLREQVTLDSLEVQPLESSWQLNNLAGSKKRSALFDRLEVVKTTVKLNKISYEALQDALRVLEVNLRLMDVQKVSYEPKNNTATLELLTYQLRQ